MAEMACRDSSELSLTPLIAVLDEAGFGLYFDWGPDSSRYLTHIKKRPTSADPKDFVELMGLIGRPD